MPRQAYAAKQEPTAHTLIMNQLMLQPPGEALAVAPVGHDNEKQTHPDPDPGDSSGTTTWTSAAFVA